MPQIGKIAVDSACKILLILGAALCLTLGAGFAHGGLGRCALCKCEGFDGTPASNWYCSCKHHYDHHYNNKKGPRGGG